MATHEISEQDWKHYLEAFSERHRGALVTIEDVDPTMPQPEIEFTDLPLVSVSYLPEHAPYPIIELRLAATEACEARVRAIPEPRCIFHKLGAGVMSSEVNVDEVLEITSAQAPPVHYLTFRTQPMESSSAA